MPAMRNSVALSPTVELCVFCGEIVTDENIVDYSDEGLGGIAHEVCPETLLDSEDSEFDFSVLV